MPSLVWSGAKEDIASAVGHFDKATRVLECEVISQDADLPQYVLNNAFMHALQSGHTSLEASLRKIFAIIDEPTAGNVPNWHDPLVSQAFASNAERPAILPPRLRAFVDETRRARNLFTRGYDSFLPERAQATIDAAKELAVELEGAIDVFINAMEPPAPKDGGPRP